jgi:drug/metabolite transporter (DMT)-like permease
VGRRSREKRERGQAPIRVPSGYRWYHPILFGAGALFAGVTLRVLLKAPTFIGDANRMTELAKAPLLAALCGALGGAGYSFVGRPIRRRLPRAGRYLAGVITTGSYLAGLVTVLWHIEPSFREEFDGSIIGAIIIGAVVTLFFGVIMGRTWFDEPIEDHISV